MSLLGEIYVCVYTYARTCMYLWKPKVNDKYLPWLLSVLFFEAGSFSEPGVQRFVMRNWPANPRDPPVCTSQLWGVVLALQAFTWVLNTITFLGR